MAEVTPEEMIKICLAAVKPYKGNVTELESAIGAFIVGKQVGWRILLLAHNRATLKKYQKILGVKFSEILPEVGELADKSIGWAAVKKIGNFWKAVKGEIAGIRSPNLRRGPQ